MDLWTSLWESSGSRTKNDEVQSILHIAGITHGWKEKKQFKVIIIEDVQISREDIQGEQSEKS